VAIVLCIDQYFVLTSHNDAGQPEMMSLLYRIDKTLQENISATRNASRIGKDEWERVLASLQLRVVPALGDQEQEILKKNEAVDFW
jgi:hypothetical protein